MVAIIDKRKNGKNKSIENRRRFIGRYKDRIKEKVDEAASDMSIKDINGTEITISGNDISEPTFSIDMSTGAIEVVATGNNKWKKDDIIWYDSNSGRGKGGGGKGEKGEDSFSFVLTKEEFMNIYFSNMGLPNFIKKSLKNNTVFKWQRHGYIKEGILPRLDLVKTFTQAIARRIATGSDRYLDEIDLRFKHYVKKPVPVREAHIFFLMDVSGSMDEDMKRIAKKFFILLYLFLSREYNKITVSFIRHTSEAEEVTEHQFFYERLSGGTVVSSGIDLINKLINETIDLSETNVYVAQASDGDNWSSDIEYLEKGLQELLSKVQYFAYIQTQSEESEYYKTQVSSAAFDVYSQYKKIKELHDFPHLNMAKVLSDEDVLPVLQQLFKKEGE